MRASRVRARREKMSRMSPVRSTTFMESCSPRFLLWAGERSSSTSRSVAFSSPERRRTSSILPLLRKVEARTGPRRWRTSPRTEAPAVSARRRSSVRHSPSSAGEVLLFRPARMARSLSGRDLQLVGDMREVFEAPIVMSVDDILDPHSQTTRRIIEAGLHGEERSGQDQIRVAGGAQARALVHLETDAVSQPVHVPLLDPLVLADGPVPVRLEEIADTLLVDPARRSDRQPIHGLLDRVVHQRVDLLQVLRRA